MNRLEKQRLILIQRPYVQARTLEGLTEQELDKLVREVELEKLQISQREADFAFTQLQITRDGRLKNIPSNWNIIRRTLGSFYSTKQFRDALEDFNFKNSLQFSGEPFAEAVREEQQTKQSEEKRRREFSAVVKANPRANIADVDANYAACSHQLEDLLAAHALTESTYIQNLTEGIVAGYFSGLAQNDPEKTQEVDLQNKQELFDRLIQEGRLVQSAQYLPVVKRKILAPESNFSELRERANLVAELSDNHSPDRFQNSLMFCDFFNSVKSNAEYRDQLVLVREKRRIAKLSPSEIRAENERVRQVDTAINHGESDTTHDGYKRLRPDSKFNNEVISKQLLWKISKDDVARLLRIYGKSQLDDRIRNGIPETIGVSNGTN